MEKAMDRTIIKNIDIIMGAETVRNGSIAIEGDRIAYAGPLAIDAVEQKGSDGSSGPEGISIWRSAGGGRATVIDGRGKLAVPGFVNAHTHSPMTLLRNFADDLAFADWLFGRIMPAEELLTAEDMRWGASLAMAEMLKSGTTAFMDMYMFMDTVAETVVETGMRANISKDVLKSAARAGEIAINRDRFVEFHRNWNGSGDGRITVSMEVHSVYLYDEPSLRAAAAIARETGTMIHIHLLESPMERENSIRQYGMDPVRACLEFGILEVPVAAAHCVHLTDDDREILSKKRVSAVHNPTSNLKLGNGIADLHAMQRAGINIAIGTDGCASNNNLNMLEEMHLAALLNKGVRQRPDIISAAEVLDMATVNGARAIGLEGAGRIAGGMKADIVLIDMDKAHLAPVRNPLSALVYSVQAADVDTVFVDGRMLLAHGELTTVDIERTKYECLKIAERLDRS